MAICLVFMEYFRWNTLVDYGHADHKIFNCNPYGRMFGGYRVAVT
jgi:hypothetical protein